MLRHASKCGAKVFEETKVTELEFEGSEQSGRPVAALWKQKSGATGRITFSYLVDASGRNGIMSTRYLKNRQFNSLLKNVACWGYWEGTGKYLPGTSRENSPLFEALAGMSSPLTAQTNLNNKPSRRIWVGLVYSSTRRNHLRRYRHEPRYFQ